MAPSKLGHERRAQQARQHLQVAAHQRALHPPGDDAVQPRQQQAAARVLHQAVQRLQILGARCAGSG